MDCVELRHELCLGIISNHDMVYHWINMANGRSYEVTHEDVVTTIIGIPSFGSNVIIPYRKATFRRLYSLSNLEDNIANLSVGDEF